MFNLVAFSSSIAQDAALANITPVTDPLVTISANNRVIFPEDYQLLGAHLMLDSATRFRLNTPSMRVIALPELYPIDVTAAVGANPPLVFPGDSAIRIPRNDEAGFDVSRGGAGAATGYAAMWVSPRRVPAPSGPIYTMRCTASLTLTTSSWVGATLTFDQILPFGRYSVVGMHVTCNDGVYARLTFPGQTQYRPGVPVVESTGEYINPPAFRYGAFGSFGSFDQTAQPGIEILGDTAGAETPVVLLDLVKVA
jgi:hypothetical protein